MSPNEIRTLLNEYYEAFNEKDEARILATFHEECEFIDLTMGRHKRGRAEVSDFVAETWRLSPYFTLEPEEILVDGDKAAVRLFMGGALRLGPNGKPKAKDVWRIPSMSFYTFKDGLMIRKVDNWNAMSIPKQVGWLNALPTIIRGNRKG